MLLCLAASACGGGAASTTASTLSTTTSAPSTSTSSTVTRPTSSTTTTTTPETAPAGGAATVAVYASTTFSFSPWAEGFDPGIGEAYLAGAWELDPDTLDLVPDLVTEIPTTDNGGVVVNPDGTMSVTYQIRPEAAWEDGLPVSGEDFAFTYRSLSGRDDPSLALYDEIIPESVTAGDKTFSFSLSHPTIGYERLFAVVLPRHAVEGTDPITAWPSRPWPSAGPFRFSGWSEDAAHAAPGSTLTFTRNESYWRTDAAGVSLPYLDTLEFHFFGGPQQAIEAFAAGAVDLLDLGTWPDVAARLSSLDGVDVATGDGMVWEQLAFQFGTADRNQASLNRSLAFRQAVAYALDRDALAAVASWMNGGALSSFLEISPVTGGQGWDRYVYDPEKALTLLEQACLQLQRDCTTSPPTVVLVTTDGGLRADVGRLAVQQLEAVGIDARLELKDTSLFFGSTFAAGDWDLGMWAWVMTGGLSGVMDTLEYWDPASPPPTGVNYQRWGTPEVSGYGEPFDQGASTVTGTATTRYATLMEEMRTTVDRSRLADLAAQAEEILADQVVLVPLATRGIGVAWWADGLAGVRLHPARPATWNAERWYRLDG
jgi:ABC-type transport system substrate-binding protein